MEIVSGMALIAQSFPTDKRIRVSRNNFFKRAFVIDANAKLPKYLIKRDAPVFIAHPKISFTFVQILNSYDFN